MKVLSRVAVGCVALGLFVPDGAIAQTKGAAKSGKPAASGKTSASPKEESPKDKAAAFAKLGAKAAASGEWDDAYADYAIAWSIDPSWSTAAGLGKAAHKTAHHAEAVQRLQFFLREAPADKVSAKERSEAEGLIQESKSKTGTVNVKGPAEAEVLVDGNSVGKMPLAEGILLDPGQHKIEVRRGAEGETRTADVVAGGTVDLDFTPKQAAPKTVIVKEEGVSTTQVRTAAVIGGGAVALAGLAAGGVLMGLSFVKADERQKAELDPGGFKAATAAAQTEADLRSASIWCFVGGGAAAIGTGVFYFVTRPRLQTPVKTGAFVGPHGASISIQGSF